MKRWERKKQSGFTIVELLIVVVVIAILAAITIVSYNGIQTRAENTKTISAVTAYVKLANMYAADNNGAYPPADGYSCLGESGTLCSNITDTVSQCFAVGRHVARSVMMTAFATVSTSTPQPSTKGSDCGGKTYAGAFYDGSRFVWFLQGTQPCTMSGLLNNQSSVQGNTTRCLGYLP